MASATAVPSTFAAGLGLLVLSSFSCATANKLQQDSLPDFLIGAFEDDYGVRYQIDRETFRLLPDDTYHIMGVSTEKGYIILQNDSLNAYAPSLFTRIDYERLENMSPYEWAFCFSSYEEVNARDAMKNVNTQKSDLMSGCNGFPFSRMKRVGESE